jgi:hypothetical protein
MAMYPDLTDVKTMLFQPSTGRHGARYRERDFIKFDSSRCLRPECAGGRNRTEGDRGTPSCYAQLGEHIDERNRPMADLKGINVINESIHNQDATARLRKISNWDAETFERAEKIVFNEKHTSRSQITDIVNWVGWQVRDTCYEAVLDACRCDPSWRLTMVSYLDFNAGLTSPYADGGMSTRAMGHFNISAFNGWNMLGSNFSSLGSLISYDPQQDSGNREHNCEESGNARVSLNYIQAKTASIDPKIVDENGDIILKGLIACAIFALAYAGLKQL